MTTTDRLQGVRTTQAIKTPVVAATTANITLSGTQTIDGVAVVAGDRVLVKDQTDAKQNGIYNCATGAWARALDFNSTAEIARGTACFVASGTANGGLMFIISTASPAIGSAMAFVQGAILPASYQPLDAGLTSIAALTTDADKMPYTTAADVYAVADLTAAGRALLDDADASAQRTTLGLGTFAVANTASYVISQGGWNTGTSTSEGTITPAKLQAKLASYAQSSDLGVNQTWQNVIGSRAKVTSYQNTTGKPIQLSISWVSASIVNYIQVSSDNATWIDVAASQTDPITCNVIVPDGWYYRVNESGGTVSISRWAELR